MIMTIRIKMAATAPPMIPPMDPPPCPPGGTTSVGVEEDLGLVVTSGDSFKVEDAGTGAGVGFSVVVETIKRRNKYIFR